MAKWLTGHFLIAGKHLRDPNFFRTAVLLVEHGPNGAMGLVINRPSQVNVSRALEGHFDLPDTGDLVYSGGPVEPGHLFILHNCGEFGGLESPVVEGLYVGSSAESFEEVVSSAAAGHPTLKFRVFAGCAGWAPEQLEGELARGDWVVTPGSTRYIFHDDPYAVWHELLKNMETPPFLGQSDVDPELN